MSKKRNFAFRSILFYSLSFTSEFIPSARATQFTKQLKGRLKNRNVKTCLQYQELLVNCTWNVFAKIKSKNQNLTPIHRYHRYPVQIPDQFNGAFG